MGMDPIGRRSRVAAGAAAALLFALAAAPARAGSAPDGGPAGLLPVRILDPRFAPFLTGISTPPPPAGDALRVSLSAGTAQVWKGDTGPGGAVGVSAQTVQSRLEGQFGIGEFLSAGFEVPALAHARSFKKDEPVLVDLRYGGAVLAEAREPVGGLAEPRFSLSAFARSPGDGIAFLRLTAAVKAPAGRGPGFLATGAADFGLFLDASATPVPRLHLHGLIGAVKPGDPAGLHGGPRVRLRSAVPFAGGLEAELGSGLAAHLQVEGVNNFFPRTGNRRLDEHPVQLTAGATLRLLAGAGAFLSFSEDITRGAPDFTVALGLWLTSPPPGDGLR